MTKRGWFVLAVLGCSSSESLPVARFANAPPVEVVDDRRDVPRPPRPHVELEDPYSYDVLYYQLVQRQLDVPRPRRALGVNSIDEVPDSTWFTNRGELTPEQVRTGPVTIESPELHVPWTVKSTKFGGASVGFIVTDARGVKYVLKFDDPAHPEVETGTDVVVDRLLWAAGFNVPEDQVVYFRPEQLVVAPDAYYRDNQGRHGAHLDRAGVDGKLAKVAHEPDGRIRALASRWIEGTPLGGHLVEGVRRDDPNDRIAHELRRDLRGMYAVFEWLDMVDTWPGNFLDVWAADPSEPNRHYVKHYALDFGLSMGVIGDKYTDLRRGNVYRFDWPTALESLFTAGIVTYAWESRPVVAIRGVGSLFSAKAYDPGRWHTDLPYLPFQTMDRFDAFWGAKLVARFTREQIRAAVEAGRFTDPRAVEYLTDTLVERQRETAAYWYRQVAPLDRFAMKHDDLCFVDLAIAQDHVAGGAATQYAITGRDFVGRPRGWTVTIAATSTGYTCVRLPAQRLDGDGYTILEVTTTRPRFRKTTYVHVARDVRGRPRVIGLWRV